MHVGDSPAHHTQLRQTQGDRRSRSRPSVGLVSRPFIAAMRA